MGLVTIWNKKNGEALHVHAVDVEEICMGGEYVSINPEERHGRRGHTSEDVSHMAQIPDAPVEPPAETTPDESQMRRGPGRPRGNT